MMRLALIVASSLLVTACGTTSTAERGDVVSGRPPVEYRGDATVTVVFASNVRKACEEAGLPPMADTSTESCTILGGKRPVIILRNPCKGFGGWARRACHEIGHVNGWPPEHGN